MSEQNHCIYEFGPFRLDAQKRLLLREGEIVPLKPKAFDTLLTLVEGHGRVLEKDELMRRVWPNTAVEEGNLTFNISTLRKALGDDPRRHEYIVTIPGEGYQFVAGVRVTFDELIVHESTSITIEEEEETDASIADSERRMAEPGGGQSALPSAAGAAPALVKANGQLSVTPPTADRRPHSSRRGTTLIAAALIAATVFVVGAATTLGLYWFAVQRRPKDEAATATPFREMNISRLTTSGKVTHAALSPDGKYVTHVTVDSEGSNLWLSHIAAPSSVRIAGPAATEYVWVAFAPDGAWVYYLTLDRDKGHTALNRVPVLGGPPSRAADDVGPVGFSPDGRQMAFIRWYDNESRLIVAEADATNERTLATLRQPEFFRLNWNAPAWSPDGKTIACQARLTDERGQYETVIDLGVEGGALRRLTAGRWYHTGQPVWLADGSGLLVTASESANDPEQVWHVAAKSGAATRVTNDLNDYHDLSLTADAGRLAAVQDHSVSSIWVAPEGDASRARQVASDTGWIEEAVWTPDGRIVYRSNAGGNAELWVMNADGSNARQLTTGVRAGRGLTLSPDGRYIFFASERAGRFNIWRVDADGGNLRQLTEGEDEVYPHCTPDGRWVVYQRGEIEPTLWKVGVDGGGSVQLTQTRAGRPAVSPDGKFIAYHYLDPDLDRWGIGIVSSAGGARLKRFNFPPTVALRFVRWSPDSQAIAYVNSPGGLSDIWLQTLDGSSPKPLTNFKVEQILNFDWSADGRSLLFVRGVETSDVVLITSRAHE